jgi:cytidylate kinase
VAIISICRGTQSGGQALAECLAEELQYPLVAREVLQDAASELGISEQELSRAMERAPRLWKRHASVRRAYIATIQAALAEHTVGGDLVYHGRAGQMLLAGLPAVLRVRLIAPMGARVSTLLERNEMTPTSAEEYIQHVDAARARWVKMMYGEDIEDPALYDMVINLQTLSVPAACNIVARAVRQPDFAVTPEVKAKLMDFRMASRVKAALASTRETRVLDLQIEGHDGVIEVSGSAPALKSGRMGQEIVEIARSVPGVDQVRLNVEWFDPYP